MKLFIFSILVLVLFSCKTDSSEEDDGIQDKSTPIAAPVNERSISTDFNDNFFAGNQEIELLKELKICDPAAKNDEDEAHPSCSPKFFRFFDLSEKIPLKDGFLLLVKAGVNGFPSRRLLVFEREKGNLVKVNGFDGYLIEKRPSPTGYDDIVVRFGEKVDGYSYFYNCLFQWKEGKYQYIRCEAINDSRIKAELVDSMAPEIRKSLDAHNMIF